MFNWSSTFWRSGTVQTEITNWASFTGIFLISGLIYPIPWGHLPCKPHKVRVSALIKPPFSDNSRVLKISDCYLKAAERRGSCSPPTATLNAAIIWGWVLLSLSSHSWLSVQPHLPSDREKIQAFLPANLTNRWVREDRHIMGHPEATAAAAAVSDVESDWMVQNQVKQKGKKVSHHRLIAHSCNHTCCFQLTEGEGEKSVRSLIISCHRGRHVTHCGSRWSIALRDSKGTRVSQIQLESHKIYHIKAQITRLRFLQDQAKF